MEIVCRTVLKDWHRFDIQPDPFGFPSYIESSITAKNSQAGISEYISLHRDGARLKYVIVWERFDKPTFWLTEFARIDGRDRVDLRQYVDRFYFEARNWLAEREVLADELDGDEVIRALERVMTVGLHQQKAPRHDQWSIT